MMTCVAVDAGVCANGSAPLALSIVYSFSRLIEGVDPCPQDLLLDQDYYLQFGVGDRPRGETILLLAKRRLFNISPYFPR